MKQLNVCLLLAVFTSGLSSSAVFGQEPEPIRTWKDITGGFSTRATFLKLKGDLVVLEKVDQKELSLPLVKLSIPDQRYVKDRTAELQRYLSARQVGPSADLAAVIASAKDNSVIKLAPGIYHLGPQTPYQQGVLIQGKRGLIISGAGREKTTIKLAANVDVGLLIGNNVENLRIEHLHIQGTPPLKTNTAAIGSTSLCTNVRNVALTNLQVNHVAVGIFLATNKGPVRDVQITNNIVKDTVGTDAGWGYGIHTRKIGNVLIAHNYIEHATRHSIYVRESPAKSRLVVEDNFILNHDLKGKNPRWYCAALNCPANQSVTRITNNFFMNTNAVGIAIMSTADDLALVNNQIIGEHYVGIWPVTGQTHTSLANSIVLHSEPVHPQWSHETSSYDWANGRETNSRLETPNPRWQRPEYVCRLGDNLFVMKDGKLDRINTISWTFQTSPTQWGNVKGMCAVENVRGTGLGHVYVVTGTSLLEINPGNWQTKKQPGDWSGARLAAATENRVHVLKKGTLQTLNLESLEVTNDKRDWSAAQWMCSWGNQLYLFDGQAHYRVNPETFQGVEISQLKSP